MSSFWSVAVLGFVDKIKGYFPHGFSSKAGLKYVGIQHALNQGEKQLGRYFVDGYAEINGEMYVWEFLDCFYHSCPFCFQPHNTCPLTGTTSEQLHVVCEEKLLRLQSGHGVKVIIMREHTWVEMKKSSWG